MSVWAAILTGGVAAAVVSGIFSVILWRLNRGAEKEDKADDIKIGLRILLYDRIKYLGKRYIEREYITAEELEDIMAMHKVYHDNLHGNGFLDSIMEQVKALQIHH